MPRSIFHFRVLVLGGLLSMVGAFNARGADEPTAPAELPLLTSYAAFWNLTDAERGREYRVRFEVSVLFYDPDWEVLWLETAGEQFFCPPGKERLGIRAGQKALLECIVDPTKGFHPRGLRFTILGEAVPLEAKDALLFLDQPEVLDQNRVRFVGLVESQREDDPKHLALRVTLGRYAADVIVLMDDADPVREYVGRLVEVDGLFTIHRAPDGSVGSIVVWVGGQDRLRTVGLLDSAEHFTLPVSSGDALREAKEGAWVRIEGVVREYQVGKSVVVWDDSEQVLVQSGRIAEPKVGSRITAVGRLRLRGLQIVLEDALWMEEGGAPHEEHVGGPGTKLRRAVQVLELGLDEAARGYPVALFGVVTWSDPEFDFFFLQDSTRGICVVRDPDDSMALPAVGASVKVTGRTGAGVFAPHILCERFAEAGSLHLPAPRAITLAQSLGGAEEAKLVEMEGYLRTVGQDGRWTVLQLSTPTGLFRAKLADPANAAEAARSVGAVVRLRGVCVAQTDGRGHQVGTEILLSGWEGVSVETPPLADPFGVDAVSVESLRKFGPLQTPYRWVRTSGVVTFATQGRFVLQSGDAGLEVFCRDQVALSPGRTVEVVGFPGRQGSRVVLREALVRAVAQAEAPSVAIWHDGSPVDARLDNRLVRIDARLEDVLQTDNGALLYLRAGEVRFLGQSEVRVGRDLARGSLLRCVGVYRVEQDLFGRPESFGLFFRHAEDVEVLELPSLFTLKHALLAVALVSMATGAALLWVAVLRRQVKAQTRQIRGQLEHQAKLEAELQKAAKLESLGLLAGGIAHDFNNLLTVVMGNITLAMLEDKAMEVAGDCLVDAERGAQRAKDLTHQLLTFAKGGEPLRAAEVLPEIVREAAEFVLRGSNVRCAYEFEAGLWAADVDRGQIGQVVHNLVLNAKQAMPDGGVIRVKAHNEELAAGAVAGLSPGRYLRLVIADTGPGLSPEVLARLFDPYFTTKKGGSGLGLATVHSIVRRHRGHIEAHSEFGHGTVFRIWLPAAEGNAVKAAAPVSVRPKSLSGRVLVMDDEEDIRRLVVSLLRRLGMEPVAVADGAEAISAYRDARDRGQPFALTIMDLTVPGGMGGREAMEELRRIDPGILAIVSSGYSNDPVLANYREYGFAGMVEKPYEVEKLMDCVGRVLAAS